MSETLYSLVFFSLNSQRSLREEEEKMDIYFLFLGSKKGQKTKKNWCQQVKIFIQYITTCDKKLFALMDV